ncbi:Ribosomal-S7 domain-containing protein [Aphelenchoides besseyi]|nr:Ribosomal-S7 domain-containing protein [Aphelenchoides besseyi]
MSTPWICRLTRHSTLCHRRTIATTTQPLMTVFDVRKFVDPMVNIEELNKPLDATDKRNFLYVKPMLFDETPVFYRDHIVDKLIRVCMMEGRKETSKANIHEALEIIKRRQFRKNQNLKEGEPEVERDPFVIAHKAIRNCTPLMKLLNVTRGGTTYKVPFPIPAAEAEFRAMKMMREICRDKAKHGATSFAEAIATELLSASENEGATIQAKQELHKVCEANRAFSHYRR